MSYYISTTTGEVKVIDDSIFADWVSKNNPKAEAYTKIADPPSPNAQWDGTKWIEPPPYIPQVVSRFQAKAALLQAGLLTQVESLIASPSTDPLVKLAWSEAVEFYRTSPTILSLAEMLDLSEEDLDELFIQAAQVQV